MTRNRQDIRVMPQGVPFVSTGVYRFILSWILPIYKISVIVLTTSISIAMGVVLMNKRKEQPAKIPAVTSVKNRTEEIKRGFPNADVAVKKLLVNLFFNEAMEGSADISVPEQLSKTEDSENRMNFEDIVN